MDEKLSSHSPEWMSIVEYARAFGVSDMTVRRKIKTGKLDHEMRGNKYYIKVDGSKAPAKTNIIAQEEITTRPVVKAPKKVVAPEAAIISSPVAKNLGEDINAAVLSAPQPAQSEIRVEAENLLRLCNTVISDSKKKESLLQAKFLAESKTLESKLRSRTLEIENLKRQLEDMQLLVKMLESKR